MKLKFDITKQEFEIVRDILQNNLPAGFKVWVFGSRAKNQARFNSDLDLAIEGQEKVPPHIMRQLKEAFSESQLPYKVDVLDIHEIGKSFKAIVEQHRVLFPLEEKQYVPRLRFPEFSGGWDEKRLGDVTTQMQSGLSRLLKDNDVGLPVIRSNNIVGDKLDISDIKYWYREDPQGANTENYFLKNGDLLINFINSIAQIGKVAVYENKLDREAIITTNLMRLKFVDAVESKFIFYFCLTKKYKLHIKTITKPAVNQASFTTKDLGNLLMHFPTKKEQQEIASFLSAVDNKIEQLSKKKQLLEQYKKGMMQKLFAQEVRFKDDNGNDYPDWEEKKLGDIADIVGGGTPETHIPKYWGGRIQWFTPTEIKQKYLFNSKRTLTDEGLKKSSAKILPIGALLLSTRATVGDIGIAGKECTTNQGFQSLIIKASDYNEFWYYWILKNKKTLLRLSSGSTFLEISKSEISKIKVSRPIKEEQTKIANFLGGLDDKINLIASELTHAQTFKKGLLQQMFV